MANEIEFYFPSPRPWGGGQRGGRQADGGSQSPGKAERGQGRPGGLQHNCPPQHKVAGGSRM
ncbi:hypothetical protein GCM10011378_37240 [Hymenobacter glacieicola]|uniref:Uncharacterized protein n=1 Tax=Hymenobacter glacieicola TaxID=1562124 RepID=A0ABQ1X6H7_9BACT|nr:hypothetical protein GCM10011378_37240 [Hymenobacter glacieicola]